MHRWTLAFFRSTFEKQPLGVRNCLVHKTCSSGHYWRMLAAAVRMYGAGS